jgi:DNA-nicking Smr family endonuclease
MPLRKEDQQLRERAMQDVQPINKPPVVISAPQNAKISPKPHTPQHTHDLHGLTLSEAHQRVTSQLHGDQLFHILTFITGKSGQIQQEFAHWVGAHRNVRKVDALPGGGAFRVHLRSSKRFY